MNHTRLLRGAGLVAVLAIVVTVMAWPDFHGTARADNTGFKSPSAVSAPQQWTNPDRAFADDNTVATETVDQEQQGYADFNLSVPAGSLILGVAVQLNAWSADNLGCELEVSLEGGSVPTAPQTAFLDNNVNAVHAVGGSTDLWGVTWTSESFTNASFVAKVKYVDTPVACVNNSQASLDHI
ncbi:MAG: hypothetical protein IIB88_06810, partial [Chloroflexi bacterium]|nr:hypothetical protein [Chloroflexota bacterium]